MSVPHRSSRLATAEPTAGIIRHVDAGYKKANEVGKQRGVNIPSHV